MPVRCLPLPLLFALLLLATTVHAQDVDTRMDPRPPAECYRFAFGQWSPPLDWTAAGHAGAAGSADAGAHGRENAAHTERDSGPLLLFPAFWPAGVLIRFDPESEGDSLTGTATALVADARRTASTATVRAVRTSCGPSNTGSPPNRDD